MKMNAIVGILPQISKIVAQIFLDFPSKTLIPLKIDFEKKSMRTTEKCFSNEWIVQVFNNFSITVSM